MDIEIARQAADTAIAKSQRETRIVWVEYDFELKLELSDRSFDEVETGSCVEFWGGGEDDADDQAWRVHMRY